MGGGDVRGRDVAGENREVLLDGLERADGLAELAALGRVARGRLQNSVHAARDLCGARERAVLPRCVGWDARARRRGGDRRSVEDERVPRLEGEVPIGLDPEAAGRRARHHRATVHGRDDDDVPGRSAPRDTPRRAGEAPPPGRGREAHVVVALGRGERQRARRHLEVGTGEEPRGNDRLGERERNGMPPGRAHDDVRVGPGPAGTASSLGNERQCEPVLLDRGPERVRPHARLGGLAHLPRDALGEEARHHVGEDRAQLVHRIESRGADAFGGWPETRCVPAAFCMLLPIPSARGAGAFGGWPA